MAAERDKLNPIARFNTIGQNIGMTQKLFAQASIAAFLLFASIATAQNASWPQWRGANQDDHSPDTGLLKKWPSEGPKLLWVYKDAGFGYSGFSVVGTGLFTMGTRGEDLVVIAVNTNDGTEIWSTKIGIDDAQPYNAGWGNGPRGTPTYADGRVYALGPKGVLACLDARSGRIEWKKDLMKDFSGQAGNWGFAESPLVSDGMVIVGPGGKEAGIVALDAKTGRTKWKADDVKPGKAEYATAIKATLHGKPQFIRFFEKTVYGVDAKNGDVLWQGEWPRGRTAVIPTPIVDGNRIYISSGYKAGSKLFEVTDDWSVKTLWDDEKVMVNHHGGVILKDGHLYGYSDSRAAKGLVCQNLETGKKVWSENGDGFGKGAVTLADGQLYCVNESDGLVSLVEATTSGFKMNGQFKLSPQSDNRHIKGKIWTHPVVIGGKLYLRDQELVHCYQVR